ncbi:hypothetical protein FSP39_022539 [Pinctada imbricata]|uniref:Uncharacterized protein n=1 Tax=Pinctada imbricata TaxID=66713 RepID=A0AA89C4Y7_PINIB|nr:hypothetical protein FSP39_022539 [Pinctada imbricata]
MLVAYRFYKESRQGHGFARKYGWDILTAKTATDEEIPLFKNMLQQAMQKKYSEFYCYANSDILFTPLLIDTLLRVSLFRQKKKVPVLIVGRRTEISVVGMKDSDNFTIVLKNGIDKGFIHTDYAVDYFIVSRDFPMKDIAPVVVGRIAYDNYIIMHARAHRVPVIDATYSNPSVHQTSTAGNYEGHLHRNKLYNKDLLEKESEISSTMYEGGRISCTNYMTKYDPLTQDVTLDKKLSKPSKCKNMFESW